MAMLLSLDDVVEFLFVYAPELIGARLEGRRRHERGASVSLEELEPAGLEPAEPDSAEPESAGG